MIDGRFGSMGLTLVLVALIARIGLGAAVPVMPPWAGVICHAASEPSRDPGPADLDHDRDCGQCCLPLPHAVPPALAGLPPPAQGFPSGSRSWAGGRVILTRRDGRPLPRGPPTA